MPTGVARNEGNARRTGPRVRYELALFGVALLVRLAYLFEMGDSPWFSVLVGDEVYYDSWARRLAGGEGGYERAFYQAPLYPHLLGALYELGGGVRAARLAQAVLGALSCVLLARAGRAFFSPRVGWIAGGLLAFYAPAIYFTGSLLKTSLALAGVCAFLAAWGAWQVRARSAALLLAGATLGLLALTRENTGLLAPVLVLVLLRGSAPRGQRIARAVAFAAAFLLPLSWTAWHNWRAEGQPRFGTANLGPNLFIGNGEGADGLYRPLRAGRGSARFERDDAVEIAEAHAGERLSSWEVSAYWRSRALVDMRAAPLASAGLFARKLYYCLADREWMDSQAYSVVRADSTVLTVLGFALRHGVWVALAACGAVLAWSERRRVWLLYGAAGLWIASVAAFFVFARFRIVWIPIFSLFAAYAIAHVRLGTARLRLAAAAVGLVAAAVAFYPPAVDEHPASASWGNLAATLRLAGRLDEADAAFERAFAARPDDAFSHFNAGLLEIERGELDSARERLEEAVRIEPGLRPDALLALGIAYAQRQQFATARAAMTQARDADPMRPEPHARLGLLLRQAGQLAEAEASYRRALELRPYDVDTRNNLGYLLRVQGRWAEAAREWEKATLADTSATRPLVNLAWLYVAAPDANVRNLELARELSRRVAEHLGASDVAVLDLEAAILAESGQFEQAVEALDRVLAQNPSAPEPLLARRETYAARRPWRLQPGQ